MKQFFYTALIVFIAVNLHSQEINLDAYKSKVELGEAALKSMKYDSCITYYKSAFTIKQTSYLSTMRAAACGFSAGDHEFMEDQLDIAFNLSWDGAKSIYDNYEEFDYLRENDFNEVINQYYKHAIDTSGVDLALMKEFENIMYEDQRYRKDMRATSKEFGNNSSQMDSLWVLQNNADSLNTIRIIEVIDSIGYPGKSVVGPSMASTAFFVIQHANLEVQEKYLDLITNAADEGEVKWRSVALLVDRVRLGQDKTQIYGSQVYTDQETGELFFGKIEQPFKVDSIRQTVGLGPLNEYANFFEFEWNPEKHVKRHSEAKE